MKIEPEQLGCDFHESYFGATYPDGRCIDGYIYDEDDCDDKGNLYMNEDADPCPKCNHSNWLEQFEDSTEMEGYEDFEKGIHKYKHKEVWHEQPEDMPRLMAWWQKGYDLAYKESKEEYDAAKAEYESSKNKT